MDQLVLTPLRRGASSLLWGLTLLRLSSGRHPPSLSSASQAPSTSATPSPSGARGETGGANIPVALETHRLRRISKKCSFAGVLKRRQECRRSSPDHLPNRCQGHHGLHLRCTMGPTPMEAVRLAAWTVFALTCLPISDTVGHRFSHPLEQVPTPPRCSASIAKSGTASRAFSI